MARRFRHRRDRLAAQRQRQRGDDAAGDVVLQRRQITERRVDGMRGDQRAARRLDQLRGCPHLVSGPKQRAHHHAIDVRLGGRGFRSGARPRTVQPSRWNAPPASSP